MRYVILILLGIFSAVLNGSLLSRMPFWGIQADMLILCALSLALCERTAMPVIFALASGLLLDILYSPIIGFFALPYTVTACAASMAISRFERINLLTVIAVGFCGSLLKDTICTAEAYLSGARFSISLLYRARFLPQALFAAAAITAAYWLISRMMRPVYMKPKIREKQRERFYNAENGKARPNW